MLWSVLFTVCFGLGSGCEAGQVAVVKAPSCAAAVAHVGRQAGAGSVVIGARCVRKG